MIDMTWILLHREIRVTSPGRRVPKIPEIGKRKHRGIIGITAIIKLCLCVRETDFRRDHVRDWIWIDLNLYTVYRSTSGITGKGGFYIIGPGQDTPGCIG